MQDRIGALEAALSTSALNERAILDAWGGDPLQKLLANLEAQRTVRALCFEIIVVFFRNEDAPTHWSALDLSRALRIYSAL